MSLESVKQKQAAAQRMVNRLQEKMGDQIMLLGENAPEVNRAKAQLIDAQKVAKDITSQLIEEEMAIERAARQQKVGAKLKAKAEGALAEMADLKKAEAALIAKSKAIADEIIAEFGEPTHVGLKFSGIFRASYVVARLLFWAQRQPGEFTDNLSAWARLQ